MTATDDTCEAPLQSRNGTCGNSVRDENDELKYPDGKCGIHSKHSESHQTSRDISEPLIQKFVDRERGRVSNGTYENRIAGLRAFDEWLGKESKDVLKIGGLSIEDYATWLTADTGRGIGDGTAQKYVEQVSKLYQYLQQREEEEYGTDEFSNPVESARENGLRDIIKDPYTSERAKAMKADEGYRAMSSEAYETFSEHIVAPTIRNQLIFQLMWDCGLRPVELCDIELSDIDRENGDIRIRSTKTHLSRTVFYGEKVATMLRLWLDTGERNAAYYAETSDYLFPSSHAEQITVDLIEREFRETAKAAELHDDPLFVDARGGEHYELNPYSLRHGFAERMIDRPNIDLETLRDVMGHASIETTKRYINYDKETRRKKIQDELE